MKLINLLDLNNADMRAFFTDIGEKPFRSAQVLQWIHQQGMSDFERMTNLGKNLKAKLTQIAEIKLPEIILTQQSTDGTRKWLMKMSCGNSVETVFIPEKTRGTLCVSSQVGCGLNCTFCSTAKQGFNRNLTTAEIIGQVWLAVRELSENQGAHDKKITNVVMMGMGEPMLNYENVIRAMDLMMDDFSYGLSKHRVTLSTSGVIPQMLRLKDESPVALAVSLHAPNNALRNTLVPINKKYPLEMLMDVCRDFYPKSGKRRVTFEYVMLKDINDSLEHARELAKLLVNVPSKINLIPFNPFPGTQYICSDRKVIEAFKMFLQEKGYNTTVRKTRGPDIAAACGQLEGEFMDRTSRSKSWQKIQFHNKEIRKTNDKEN